MAVNWVKYKCPQCGKETTQSEKASVYCAQVVSHDRRKQVRMRKK